MGGICAIVLVSREGAEQPAEPKENIHILNDISLTLFPVHLLREPRKELLALDPCVTEEFLKLYVAYKAETNFVDVVPQTSRLRLSLNMPFHELHDPRGIAKDVSNVGRWGNGDVEVGLNSLDEMPYVLGLIRQSFGKQMGNGESGE